jgi:hypothetical protein
MKDILFDPYELFPFPLKKSIRSWMTVPPLTLLSAKGRFGLVRRMIVFSDGDH